MHVAACTGMYISYSVDICAADVQQCAIKCKCGRLVQFMLNEGSDSPGLLFSTTVLDAHLRYSTGWMNYIVSDVTALIFSRLFHFCLENKVKHNIIEKAFFFGQL